MQKHRGFVLDASSHRNDTLLPWSSPKTRRRQPTWVTQETEAPAGWQQRRRSASQTTGNLRLRVAASLHFLWASAAAHPSRMWKRRTFWFSYARANNVKLEGRVGKWKQRENQMLFSLNHMCVGWSTVRGSVWTFQRPMKKVTSDVVTEEAVNIAAACPGLTWWSCQMYRNALCNCLKSSNCLWGGRSHDTEHVFIPVIQANRKN